MKTSPTSFESVQDIVVEFHKLAHEFKKPEYLEIAGMLGKVTPDTFNWEQKVNEGCDRQGIPHTYPKTH